MRTEENVKTFYKLITLRTVLIKFENNLFMNIKVLFLFPVSFSMLLFLLISTVNA